MTPNVLDVMISYCRKPRATLEARAETRLAAGPSPIPRGVNVGVEEYDPLLAALMCTTPNSKIHIGQRPWLGRNVQLRSRRQIRFGRNAIVRSGTILSGRSRHCVYGIDCGDDFYVKENAYLDAYGGWIKIGRGAALAQAAVVHGNGGITIGDYLMMGHGAMILAGNHNHAMTDQPFIFQGSSARGIIIGNNVWIGAGAIILDGSTVGDNVVIGAGAVLQGSVPSSSLVTGRRELSIRPLTQAIEAAS